VKIIDLRIRGFRSFYDAEWRPGDLNILIGPNASGKSNLLRALEMLSVSATGGLGKYVQREGGMEPIVWDGTAEQVELSVKTTPLDSARDIQRNSLTYIIRLARLGLGSGYRLDHELLGNFYKVEIGTYDQPFKLLERTIQHAVVFDEQQREFVAPPESVSDLETLLSVAAGPFAANHYVSQFQRYMAGWTFYKDIQLDRGSVVRQPTVTASEKIVSSDAQNLIAVLHTLYSGDREFKRDIDSAMRAAFGGEFEEIVFPPAADQRIQLRVRWKSLRREQSAADLSDGTLRFLFLMAVLANPDSPSLIAIDEPEIGLHPSMLPIIAEYAKEASTRAQVILTTHSPALLDAFTSAEPQITVVEWPAGKTQLRVCSGDELRYWLKEYTLGQLYQSGQLEASE
jgi:predicted ATPase